MQQKKKRLAALSTRTTINKEPYRTAWLAEDNGCNMKGKTERQEIAAGLSSTIATIQVPQASSLRNVAYVFFFLLPMQAALLSSKSPIPFKHSRTKQKGEGKRIAKSL